MNIDEVKKYRAEEKAEQEFIEAQALGGIGAYLPAGIFDAQHPQTTHQNNA